MNKVLLVGRIATDPTNRATSSNVQVSNFSVACNGSFSKANQQNNTANQPTQKYIVPGNPISFARFLAGIKGVSPSCNVITGVLSLTGKYFLYFSINPL